MFCEGELDVWVGEREGSLVGRDVAEEDGGDEQCDEKDPVEYVGEDDGEGEVVREVGFGRQASSAIHGVSVWFC